MLKILHLLLVSTLLLGGCASAKEYKNNYVEHHGKGMIEFLRMKYFSDVQWPDHQSQGKEVPQTQIDINKLHSPPLTSVQISWLGHSTFLIQYQGINILTDPILSQRASPISFAGPLRYTPAPISVEQLPNIDFVIISHNHYDHLDKPTIESLNKHVMYIVPEGLKSWFTSLGLADNQVTELSWWEKKQSGSKVIFTATPSQHWSARSLFDRYKSHWASWHIEVAGKSFWFAGDTGYNPHDFKRIGDTMGEVDFALIPIGAYAPRYFMRLYHVNVEEAVQIHQDVKSRHSLGMHWGTFPLTSEPALEPYKKLKTITSSPNFQLPPFESLAIGETRIFH